jgi:flagellar biosynthesis protein FlhF
MKYKRYEAKTLKEALTQVKQELGPNALILSTRSFRKDRSVLSMLGKPWMEVTAAADTSIAQDGDQTSEIMNSGKSETPGTHPLWKNGPPKFSDDRLSTRDSFFDRQTCGSTVCSVLMKLGFSESLLHLFRRLEAQGIENTVSLEILESIRSTAAGPEEINDHARMLQIFRDHLIRYIATIEPISSRGTGPIVMNMLGPTGVGKTTTVAKLAARFALAQGKRVVLATQDTYRIAAVEQLKIYANIMGLPLEVIHKSMDLDRLFKTYADFDLILLDTAGRSPNNELHLQDLKDALPYGDHVQNFLLVSATTNDSDARRIVERFSLVDLKALIVTKVDECSRFGPMLGLLHQTELPLAYITTGQKVPDDLEVAHVDRLLKRLLTRSG